MLSQNLVKKVSYRKDILVIEFNKFMTKYDKYNFLQRQGIYVYVDEKKHYLEMTGDSIDCFMDDTVAKFHCNYQSNCIKYRVGKLDTVYYGSTPFVLGDEVEDFNLAINTTAIVIDDNTLRLIYNGRNRLDFNNIKLKDFVVDLGMGNLSSPSCIEYGDLGSYIFRFNDNIFEGYNSSLGKFKIIENGTSKDIYGYKIKTNVVVNIIANPKETIINNFSLSSFDAKNNIVCWTIDFSNEILRFCKDDFTILYKEKKYRIEYTKYICTNSWVIYSVIKGFDVDEYNLAAIYTSKCIRNIRTTDEYINRVNQIEPVYADRVIANKIIWTSGDPYLAATELKGSEFTITYSEDIEPSSIVPDVKFNGSNFPWDGNLINISPDNMKISLDGENIILCIPKTNFGEIIFSKTNIDSINWQLTKPCTLMYNTITKSIVLSFNSNETMIIDIQNKFEVMYNPNEKIRSKNNRYIFIGEKPVEVYEVIIVEPGINPFSNGGVLNSDYILKVTHAEVNRNYVGPSNTDRTMINGNVTIVGSDLISSDIINIQYLNITGYLIVKVLDADISSSDLSSIAFIAEEV